MLRFVCRPIVAIPLSLALDLRGYAVETLRLLASRSITHGVKILRLPEMFIPS